MDEVHGGLFIMIDDFASNLYNSSLHSVTFENFSYEFHTQTFRSPNFSFGAFWRCVNCLNLALSPILLPEIFMRLFLAWQ